MKYVRYRHTVLPKRLVYLGSVWGEWLRLAVMAGCFIVAIGLLL